MEQQNINNQINEKKRPTAISIICILGLIGVAFTIPLILSNEPGRIGSWYPPYLGLSLIINVVCMVGLWQMKKWAAYTYTGFVLLNQIVLLTMGNWNVMALIIPAIGVGVALTHVKRMD